MWLQMKTVVRRIQLSSVNGIIMLKQNSLLASFNAFKFPSSDNIRFQCNIRVCFGRCQPVNCRGYNAFGRRRRRREIGDTNSSSTSVSLPGQDGLDGTLREEITISSNAILTFEKRDERLSDGSESKSQSIAIEFHHLYQMHNVCISCLNFQYIRLLSESKTFAYQ